MTMALQKMQSSSMEKKLRSVAVKVQKPSCQRVIASQPNHMELSGRPRQVTRNTIQHIRCIMLDTIAAVIHVDKVITN